MSQSKDSCTRLEEECKEMVDNLSEWVEFQDPVSFRSNKEQIIYFLDKVEKDVFS